MTDSSALQIDTHWIRRASATVQESSRAFAGVAAGTCGWLSARDLGGSAAAVAAATRVNARTGQAHQGAAQLQAVSAWIGHQLLDAAAQFDRLDSAMAVPIR